MRPVRHLSASPESLAALHAEAFLPADRWSASGFAALLEQPEVDGFYVPGAFILFRVVLDEAELLTLCTAPEKRGQGLAKKLLEKMLAELEGQGVSRVFLEVEASNTPAQGLYQAFGFCQVGERKNYYGLSRTALVFEKRMAASSV